MKKYLKLVAIILASNWAVAQEKDSIQTLPPVTVTTASNVNAEVTRSFDKHFKDATNAKWYVADKDYLVKFIQKDMNNNAYFKENGRLVYHISYGYEKNLQADIRQLVKDSYPDYIISRAIQVRAQSRNIWVINLEGIKRWVVVSIEEGNLEEVKNFEKG
jgi:hypothetical protein